MNETEPAVVHEITGTVDEQGARFQCVADGWEGEDISAHIHGEPVPEPQSLREKLYRGLRSQDGASLSINDLVDLLVPIVAEHIATDEKVRDAVDACYGACCSIFFMSTSLKALTSRRSRRLSRPSISRICRPSPKHLRSKGESPPPSSRSLPSPAGVHHRSSRHSPIRHRDRLRGRRRQT